MSKSLLLPNLSPLYDKGGEIALTVLRIVAGIALMIHGAPKIMNPTGAAGMVEMIGFAPGVFWSVLLSIGEFSSGLLLVAGLLTRPSAFVATVILAVTIYFHWIVLDQGWDGAEKSILWTAVLLLFIFVGGGRHSVDRLIGREV